MNSHCQCSALTTALSPVTANKQPNVFPIISKTKSIMYRMETMKYQFRNNSLEIFFKCCSLNLN